MTKRVVTDKEYVVCPYCIRENRKTKLKLISNTHLKIHNKTFSQLIKEFPNIPTITKDQQEIKSKSRKKLKCEFCDNLVDVPVTFSHAVCKICKSKGKIITKIVLCSVCGKEINVPIQSSNNNSVCRECRKQGHKNKFASHHGKIGSDKIKNLYRDDPKKLKSMKEKVSYSQSQLFKNEKSKNTILDKRQKTYLKKTGYFHQMHNPEVKEKIKQTNLKRLGVEYPLQSDKIKEKVKKTNLKKYGVEYPLSDPKFRKKNEEEYIKKYGVSHWSKTSSGKEILRNLSLARYEINRESILNQLNLKLVDPEYIHAHYPHKWLCLKCKKTFTTIWNNIQQGYLCPFCYPRTSNTSLLEQEIFEFLTEILSNHKIIKNDRKIIYPFELDLYIPEKKLAIEHDGLFWHSNKPEDINKNKDYHLNKTLKCQKVGIRLIHIFEDEWIFKKEICKARLSYILKVSKAKHIYARNCQIKEIDTKTKDKFLNTFHIQGTDIGSHIRLGAFFNNKLVAVMTFRRGNISKGNRSNEIIELNRFCSDYHYNVVGIAGKLLTYFETNYKYKTLISYADARWSEGSLYFNLGFDFVGMTGPNYWYIKGYKRIHRFGLRKRKEENPIIPERTLRLQEGYRIIWDCGSYKFTKSKKRILE